MCSAAKVVWLAQNISYNSSDETSLQEPVIGISLILRTSCWLNQGFSIFPHEHILLTTNFGKPHINLVFTFSSEIQD